MHVEKKKQISIKDRGLGPGTVQVQYGRPYTLPSIIATPHTGYTAWNCRSSQVRDTITWELGLHTTPRGTQSYGALTLSAGFPVDGVTFKSRPYWKTNQLGSRASLLCLLCSGMLTASGTGTCFGPWRSDLLYTISGLVGFENTLLDIFAPSNGSLC